MAEAGLDLLGHDDTDATTGQEPEDEDELTDRDRHDHDHLQEHGAGDDRNGQLRSLGDGLHR